METLRAISERMAKGDEKKKEQRRREISEQHGRVFEKSRKEAAKDGNLSVITKRFLSLKIGEAIGDDVVIFNEYDLDPFLVPRKVSKSWFENSFASGLGWSMGAAIGGKLGARDRTIVVTLGDGSYFFNTPLSAHYVMAAYKLPILIIGKNLGKKKGELENDKDIFGTVFNDTAWSTIKKSTKGSHPQGFAAKHNNFQLCDFSVSTEFEKVAEACGGIGIRVEQPSKLAQELQRALHLVRTGDKHVLLNVICQRDG